MEGKNPDIPIDPANLPKIYLLLTAIAVLIAIGLFFGRMGAEKAEKRGHQRHFGFLLCFYFGPLGLWWLDRLEINRAELDRRAREEARQAAEAEDARDGVDAPAAEPAAKKGEGLWVPTWTRQPNWTPVYVLLGVAVLMTAFLRFRPEEDGLSSVDVRNISVESKQGWQYLGDAPESDDSKKTMESIHADSYITRYYRSASGQVVELYVVYRRYGRREFNHNPDQCFPAGGWVKMKSQATPIQYASQNREALTTFFDGKGVISSQKDPATGKHLVGLPPATVTYFFASGDRTETVFLKQQMWMALERLIPNKNGWALIRLTTVRHTTDEDALEAHRDFLRVYGPDIQRNITTDAEHSKGVTP
jgi:EpsI family protein